MCESDFRKTLTPEQLEARAFIIPFKVCDFDTLKRLDRYSTELEKPWDVLINVAVTRLLDDIEAMRRLRD